TAKHSPPSGTFSSKETGVPSTGFWPHADPVPAFARKDAGDCVQLGCPPSCCPPCPPVCPARSTFETPVPGPQPATASTSPPTTPLHARIPTPPGDFDGESDRRRCRGSASSFADARRQTVGQPSDRLGAQCRTS